MVAETRPANPAARLLPASVLVLGGSLVAVAPTASAADLIVTTLDDVVNSGDGQTSLREAIQTANAGDDLDVITFASEVTGSIDLVAPLDIRGSLQIRGPGVADLTISNGSGTVFTAADADSLTISDLSIDSQQGVAVYAYRDTGFGGRRISPDDLTLSRVDITGTVVGLKVAVEDSFVLEDSRISGSHTGITALYSYGDMLITDSTISGAAGGGAKLRGRSIGIVGSTFTDNSIALRTYLAGEVSIADSTFSANSTAIDAGCSRGDSTIERSTFTGNGRTMTSSCDFLGPNALALISSTVTGNDGALELIGSDVRVMHSTITGNGSSPRPMVRGATVTINHSIVTDNGARQAAPAGAAVTNSMVPTGSNLGPSNIESDDPELGPLADNGGSTETMRPHPSSLVVDAGDSASVGEPSTDQRGAARIFGPEIDLGAVELDVLAEPAKPFVRSVTPARIVDTRPGAVTIDGRSQAIGRLGAGSSTTFTVAGRAGVPDTALAAVINVTSVNPARVGFLTVHPCLETAPLASSLNHAAIQNAGNEIVAPLDPNGDICVFNSSDVDLVIDVSGYVPDDSGYKPIAPSRLLDTRVGARPIDGAFQLEAPRSPSSTLALAVADRGLVPSEARSVVINITAVAPTANGFVTAQPCGAGNPTTAAVNYRPGITRGNEIIVPLDDDGTVCLYTSSETHLVVDVVGHISASTDHAAVGPLRFVDTRPQGVTFDGEGAATGAVTPSSVLVIDTGIRRGVPSGATGLSANITAIRPAGRGFITVWDCSTTRPNVSSLNFEAGDVVGNEILLRIDADGRLCMYSSISTDVTVDVSGFSRLPA